MAYVQDLKLASLWKMVGWLIISLVMVGMNLYTLTSSQVFLKELHEEVIRLEFSHYDVKSMNSIPAKDFALSMVASADMNHISKLLDRADMLDNDPDLKHLRITFEEFKAFADLRRRLESLTMAIFAYGQVNGMLTKQDLKRAAQHVSVLVCYAHLRHFDSESFGLLPNC